MDALVLPIPAFLPFPMVQRSQHASPPGLGGFEPLGTLSGRSSEPQPGYQKGLRIAYTFHLWKSFPVLSPGFRNPGFPVRQDIGHIQCLVEFVDLLLRTHSIRRAAYTQCLGPWRQAGSGSGGPTERERSGSKGGASSPGPTPGVKHFPLGPKSGHFQGKAASAGVPQWGPVWPNGAPHTRRRCHRALGEGGAAVGRWGIMHKPCGWHNVAFISLPMQRGDRRNNPDSVTRVLWGVQASRMKMNWRGNLPFVATALATYIFMDWRDSSWE